MQAVACLGTTTCIFYLAAHRVDEIVAADGDQLLLEGVDALLSRPLPQLLLTPHATISVPGLTTSMHHQKLVGRC